MAFTIIIFILTLLVLIVSHEFGHFIAAKKFGVKVLEFGFGLPPRIWGKKIGETLVSLNWLPIGGFVRLFGEDETDKKVLEDKRSFAAQSVLGRIGIVVAGVVMNFLFAVILFWIVLIARGFSETIPLITDFHFIGVNQVNHFLVLIGGVAPGSPAEQAGLQSNEQVISVNDIKIDNAEQLINYTKIHSGEKIVLTVAKISDNLSVNPGSTRTVILIPRVNPPAGQGPMGVQLGTITMAVLNYNTLPQKVFSGITHAYNLTAYSFKILGDLISASIRTGNIEPVSQSVSGPVGITQMTNVVLHTQSPLIPYLNFVALLALNLAILNILPFPALDGGRLFFLLIEAIFRRRVKAEIEKWVHTVGMALLLALILVITFSDIRKAVMP